jgi:hypothetical protein
MYDDWSRFYGDMTLLGLTHMITRDPRSPANSLVLRSLIQGVRSQAEPQIHLIAICSNFELSTVSRASAIELLKKVDIPLPSELTEPRTLDEAKARIVDLTALLDKRDGEGPEGGTGSKVERTTLLILAALAVEYAAGKATPKYRLTDGQLNISALAADIEKRLPEVHGASNSSIRARLTAALAHYAAEVKTEPGSTTGPLRRA